MDNLQPASLDPNELPEGFSATGAPSTEAAQKAAAAEEQRQAILEQVLSPEALARLRRIKLVKHAKAEQLEKAIVSMAMTGKLPGTISEDKLIEMLERGNRQGASKESGTISIQRKNYGMDSDDDDDDDDELY